ncbi:MAG TPA: amidohydrolase family protein [Acidimicrobiia bacterium]|nr:amidohydrolase family protein [Acidimicrobiia bacterium]
MIIDAHAHLVTPLSVFAVRTILQAAGGQHSKEWYVSRWIGEDDIARTAETCVALMDEVGTDVQLLSPRPFVLMHSHHDPTDVRIWAEINNDLIAETVRLHPDRFRGVAGLPQVDGHPVGIVFDELRRCVDELGFVGVLLNPDPAEGRGTSPRLGDPYWYPLWELLCELDVPAHVHSAGCAGRETYDEHFATEESLAITSVIRSGVFARFPTLKLIISHGGGSIPYQIGRWRAFWFRDQAAKHPHIDRYFRALEAAGRAGAPLPDPPDDLTSFDEQLQRFWFDTDLHNPESLELLFKMAGPERCLFGTERPGSGNAVDPATGRNFEDFRFTIDRLPTLSDKDRALIYEHNAREVFSRLNLACALG